jgi:hypothetical protein
MESNSNVTFSISVTGGAKGAKTDGIEVHLAGYYEGIHDDMDDGSSMVSIFFFRPTACLDPAK